MIPNTVLGSDFRVETIFSRVNRLCTPKTKRLRAHAFEFTDDYLRNGPNQLWFVGSHIFPSALLKRIIWFVKRNFITINIIIGLSSFFFVTLITRLDINSRPSFY